MRGAPQFAVVQSGHSGSGYTAAVCYAAGLPLGHEQWWTLPHLERVRDLAGDSSWLAVTDPAFPGFTGPVFHQVRHPLTCIGSLAHYYAGADDDDYLRRRLDFLGVEVSRFDVRSDPVLWAARTWLRFNEAAAHRAILTWRVEDFGATHVHLLAEAAGYQLDPTRVSSALIATPRDLNAHGRIPLTLDDIARLSESTAMDVAAAAGAYGYGRLA